ncbi:MAG: glycosyltransferase [Candidatus Marinimicrobia bacterium]|nr:glycosyltransferase [Candidatus Neomarinimicrobiota bacterium]
MNSHMKDAVKISACLMVKNEEEMLPGCLDSIKEFVDEIIIVDTGSEDNTVQIADSYGAKIYHHPWEHDFSKHRNQSISYANGDWFLMIDADERLQTLNSSADEIKRKLAKLDTDVHAVLITMRDYRRDGELKLSWKVSKLFRNGVDVKYEGIVHNQPVIKGKMVDSDIVINHYGYDLSQERMDKKFERSNSLLQKRIEKNPDDFEAYFYLANMYSAFSRFEEGLGYGKQCLKHLPDSQKQRPVYLKIHYNIGASYLRLEEYHLAEKWFKKGLSFLPKDIDLFYGLVMLGVQTDNTDLIITYAKKYLINYDDFIDNPLKADSRFMYNLDITFKEGILVQYINALIKNDDISAIEESIDTYFKMFEEKQLAIEVLKSLKVLSSPDLLIKYSIIFSDLHNHDSAILSPLVQVNKNKSLINAFINTANGSLRDYSVLGSLISGFVYSNQVQDAQKIFDYYADKLPRDILLSSKTLIGYYQGSQEKVVENTWELLESGFSDREYYVTIIPHLYNSEEFELLQIAVSHILPEYDSLDNIPELILLPLARVLLNENDMDFFLQVVQVISAQHVEFSNYTITSINDLGSFFSTLSNQYMQDERMQLAEFSLDIAYTLTDDLTYLAERGSIAFERGDLSRSLEYYSSALDKDFRAPSMIKNMSTIFGQLGDESGKKHCEMILENL